MFSQAPSTSDLIAGKIQARLAEFFGLKEALNNLSFSANLAVRDKATLLLGTQSSLEREWNQSINAKVAALSQGNWAITDIPTLGAFYGRLEKQIGDVHRLQDESRGIVSSGSGLSLGSKFEIGGGVLFVVLAGVVYLMFRRPRRYA